MFDKEYNRQVVLKMVNAAFWQPEYDGIFDGDVVFEFPCAPPGMPSYMNYIEVDWFRSWLARTVESWDNKLLALYGSPDPNVFYTVRECEAVVHWGGNRSDFSSRMINVIRLKDGKIAHVREWFDALAFLRAAGREVPVFGCDLYHPKIEAAYPIAAEQAKLDAQKPVPELDASPEAIQARINAYLNLMRKDDWTTMDPLCVNAPGFEKHIYFAPPDMRDPVTEEDKIRMGLWGSMTGGGGCDPRGEIMPTDDPHIYICATYGFNYNCTWLGNAVSNGHYRNTNCHRLIFDDLGRCVLDEEYFNSINKFNSVNLSVPSFPYFY